MQKKCPCCGAKGDTLALGDSKNKTMISTMIASVPHPEKKNNPNWEKKTAMMSAMNQKKSDKEAKKQGEKERLQNLKNEKTPYCPKCYSVSLSAHKKGFGIGKAVVGGAIIGPFGLIAGNAGAKKVRVTCLNCGHQFFAGSQ